MEGRKEQILRWLERIERSTLSAPAFFVKADVPFSLTQFYRYRKAFGDRGIDGLEDGRSRGNNLRIHPEAEGFLVGYAAAHPDATQGELRKALWERFGISISQPGLSQCMGRLGIRRERGSQVDTPSTSAIPYAGFELVVGLAWHFRWPQWTAQVIREAVGVASERFARQCVKRKTAQHGDSCFCFKLTDVRVVLDFKIGINFLLIVRDPRNNIGNVLAHEYSHIKSLVTRVREQIIKRAEERSYGTWMCYQTLDRCNETRKQLYIGLETVLIPQWIMEAYLLEVRSGEEGALRAEFRWRRDNSDLDRSLTEVERYIRLMLAFPLW